MTYIYTYKYSANNTTMVLRNIVIIEYRIFMSISIWEYFVLWWGIGDKLLPE